MLRTGLRIAATLMVAAAASGASASAAFALPEWSAPFPKPMSITSGPATLESASGEKIECGSDVGSGEVTSPVTGNATVFLSGCGRTLPVARIPCTTPGLPPETIAVTAGTRLGYIVHTPVKTQVGLELTNGNLLAMFACGETRVLLKGAIIGKLTPLNKAVKAGKAFTLKFSQSKGKQKPLSFEGEPPAFPEISFGGPFEPAGFSSTEKLTYAEVVTLIG